MIVTDSGPMPQARLKLKTELATNSPTGVLPDELPDRARRLAALSANLSQLVGYVFGHVTGPALRAVKGDDTDRSFILPVEQVPNEGCTIGFRVVGLPPDLCRETEI